MKSNILNNEDKYQELANSISDIFFALDEDLRYTFWNNASEKLTGISSKEAVGKSIYDIFPEITNTKIEETYKKALRTKRNSCLETEFIINNIKYYFDINIYPSSSGLVVLIKDITEKKLLENKLRESEILFKNLFRGCPSGVLVIDPNGLIVKVNDTLVKMLGFSKKEIINKGVYGITYAEDIPITKKVLDAFKNQKINKISLQKRYITKNKGFIWANSSIRSFKYRDNEYYRLVSIEDITEIKGMLFKLEESNEKYQTIIENMPVLEYMVDCSGKILDCNKLTLKTLGYNKKELIGSDVIKIYAPEFKKKAKELFLKWKNKGSIKNKEVKIMTKNSHVLDAILNISTLHDKDGKSISTISTLLDISRRKKTERELEYAYNRISEVMSKMIEALARITEIRDPYTAGHQRKVTAIATAIAKKLGLKGNQVEGLRIASMIHDIGKINVPASILVKPGELSELELELVKTHPYTGYELLKDIDFQLPIANIILQHHERIDGSGYPNGIKGKDMLIEAKILAIADVIEAMVSHRPYRAALGIEKALEELEQNKGILYDEEIVIACRKLMEKKVFLSLLSN